MENSFSNSNENVLYQPDLLNKIFLELLEQRKILASQKKYRYKIYQNREYIHLFDEDIYFIEADGNYSKYHCNTKNNIPSLLVSTIPLKETEKILNPNIFIRCHESFIVNTNYIRKNSKNRNCGGIIILADCSEIPYTKQYKRALNENGCID